MGGLLWFYMYFLNNLDFKENAYNFVHFSSNMHQ